MDEWVVAHWSKVSRSYLQCDLLGQDDPEGTSHIWGRRQVGKKMRIYNLWGCVPLCVCVCGLFCGFSSQEWQTSCVLAELLVFWDCKSVEVGMVNLNASLLRLQSLTHPTTTPSTGHPALTFCNTQAWTGDLACKNTHSNNMKYNPNSCDETWDGGWRVQALSQLLASLEPPDPSSPPEWVLPLPNTVGECTRSVWRVGFRLHGAASQRS